MFAYCGNNPINNVDPAGTYYCQVKENRTACVGSFGVSGDALASMFFLVSFVESIQAMTQSATVAKEDEDTKAQTIVTTSSQNNEAKFYGVDLYGGTFRTITPPMSFDTALTWAYVTAASHRYSSRQSWGIRTEKSKDAIQMAIALTPVGPVVYDPANPKRGHLGHFHTAYRCIGTECAHSFHVWFDEL